MSSGVTPVNRKDVRAAIADSLAVSCPSALAVYGYSKTGFEGDTPIIRLMASGSERQEVEMSNGYQSAFFFDLQILVLSHDKNQPKDEMMEAACNTLDDLEFEVFQWFADHQQVQDNDGLRWSLAMWDQRSIVEIYPVGAFFYLVETISIRVEVKG